MFDRYEEAVAKGRRAGFALAAALLYGCGAGAQPLHLPEGHPALPATAGTPRTAEPPPADAPPPPTPVDPHAGHRPPALAPAPVAPPPAAAPVAPPPLPAPAPAPAPVPAPAAPKVYACPMHPEVVSNEPGRCPKCEMRLQEVKPAPREEGK